MATLTCTPATRAAQLAACGAGDTLIHLAGDYPTWSWKAGVTFRTEDWAPYRAVDCAKLPTGEVIGHYGRSFACRITAPAIGPSTGSGSMAGAKFEGFWHDCRGDTAGYSNQWLIDSANVAGFEARDFVVTARKTNNTRSIYLNLINLPAGGGALFERFRINGVGQAGNASDHAIYMKSKNGWSGAPFTSTPCASFREFIIDQGGSYPLHFYPASRGFVFEDGLIYRAMRGMTFSANNSDSSVGSSNWGTTAYNRIRRVILSDRTSAIGSWEAHIEGLDEFSGTDAEGYSRPHDNLVVDSAVYRGNGQPQTHQADKLTAGFFTFTNVRLNNTAGQTPGYADPDNGDFRLSTASRAYLDGVADNTTRGPSTIWPGWSTGTNTPPSASINASATSVTTGTSVTFTDTSSDPDGTIVSRAWDLDNDGAFDDGTGATATTSWTTAGTKTVRLQVTDNAGATAVATATITVTDPATTPPPSGSPSPAATGTVLMSDGFNTTDGVLTSVTAGWQAGPWTSDPSMAVQAGAVWSGSATDGQNANDVTTQTFSLDASPPVGAITPPSGLGFDFIMRDVQNPSTTGKQVWLYALHSAGSPQNGYMLRYTGWAANDSCYLIKTVGGTETTLAVFTDATLSDSPRSFRLRILASGALSFFIDSPYGTGWQILGEVTDTAFKTGRLGIASNGPGGRIGSVEVRDVAAVSTTTNQPPAVALTASATNATPGQVVTFTADVSDPDGTISTVEWDLDNDGAFDDATGTGASRSWPTPGTYTVRVKATDNNGAATTRSITVTVAYAPVEAGVLTLTSSGPRLREWMLASTDEQPTTTPAAPGPGDDLAAAGRAAQQIGAWLEHLRVDEESDVTLDALCHALAAGVGRVHQVAVGDDVLRPWQALTDPGAAPLWSIGHAAQYVGGQLPARLPGESDDAWLARARWMTAHSLGMLRGGLEAITRMVQETLTGQQRVWIRQATSGPFEAVVHTMASETPNPAATAEAANAYAPAGVRLTVETITGQTYDDVAAKHATYDAASSAYDDYDDMSNTAP